MNLRRFAFVFGERFLAARQPEAGERLLRAAEARRFHCRLVVVIALQRFPITFGRRRRRGVLGVGVRRGLGSRWLRLLASGGGVDFLLALNAHVRSANQSHA